VIMHGDGGERRLTDGVLHDDGDGEHGPEGGEAPVVEDGADVVEHGHQRERQPDLERVRHPPGIVGADLHQLPGEPGQGCSEPAQRRDEPLPAPPQEPHAAAAPAADRRHCLMNLHGRYGCHICRSS
jgi:hypothetical protein